MDWFKNRLNGYFCLFSIKLSQSQIDVYFRVSVQFCEHLFLLYNETKIYIKQVIKLNRVHDLGRGRTDVDPICYYLDSF
jgi:hypothetical protein